jgi:DNA helicase II / ATP-dependent DNA helicase PcrA
MSFLEQLNGAQRDAVTTIDGPLIIIAGAGSGKTRVLTYRAAYLIGSGIRPDSILALTFTNKAANEMKSRITALMHADSRSIWMGTFHSIFARILRMEGEHIGYGRNFTIYDTDDSLALVKNVMNQFRISQQQFNPQGIRSRISAAKNQMISPDRYNDLARDPLAERTGQVFEEYERKLKMSNAMDFDDLLLKPIELFRENPLILQRYQNRFRYILVDEYQDTNRVQYLLIRELAKAHRNICVVGDDAQSIYAFRGADIRNILDFEKDYAECKLIRLEQNYRSTKTILAAAGSVIRNNVDQIPKTLWTENPEGEPLALHTCADDREEGYKVVALIEEESRRKKLDLKDFAVLYRTNAQSRSLEDALRRNGIPYIIVGGVAFYKRKEIKDVLAYLRVIVNPQDEESLLRIINFPTRSIGDTTVAKLKTLAGEKRLTLYDALGLPEVAEVLGERAAGAVQRFSQLLRKYIGLKDQISASEIAAALVDELGILSDLKDENTVESLGRRENIQELISALTEFNDAHPGEGLEGFLEEVSLVSDVDMAEFGRNAVTLMTLHAAKGLEFPVVFIAGLEEGLFPVSNAMMEPKDLEEERRLFYVGLTRAMQKVHLLHALTRYRFGELGYSVKSRFLDEIDQNLIVTATQSQPVAYRRPGNGTASTPKPDVFTRRKQEKETDKYFSDQMPAYEDESQEPSAARVGARVMHESFGKGKVIAIDGRGENARAVVDFESVGRKHLMLKFANLRAAR